MTTLLIARHGNTFDPGQTPTRVGARTDLPLVEKGREQAGALGRYLKENGLLPDAVYCSMLSRTRETAELALKEAGVRLPVYALEIFNEIDYGPDENKTEEEVIARIGKEAIERWDAEAILPEGWDADTEEIICNWRNFAAHMAADNLDGHRHETILVVTSNGIARFAPRIAGNYEDFRKTRNIKLSTGAFGILTHSGGVWRVEDWNVRPS